MPGRKKPTDTAVVIPSGHDVKDPPILTHVLLPFHDLLLERDVDHFRCTVEGSGVSMSGTTIVPTPGATHPALTVVLDTPQHWAEPSVNLDTVDEVTHQPIPPSTPPPLWMVAAGRTRLVVPLADDDRIEATAAGILGMLQTHVLGTDTRLVLPTALRLGPASVIAADDVPVLPVDTVTRSGGLRERWHLVLRRLTATVKGEWIDWERHDDTEWRVTGIGTGSPAADPRPAGTRPTFTQLQQILASSKPSLVGKSLVLSGGGGSGQLEGRFGPGPLALYRERFMTGRSTAGMTVTRGILYPFALEASLVETWQRELNDHPVRGPQGETRAIGAYLVVSRRIVISRLFRDDLAHHATANPFVRVDAVNPVRENIPEPTDDDDQPGAFPVPSISYVVTDRAGGQHRIEVPGYFLAALPEFLPTVTDAERAATANALVGRVAEIYAPSTTAPEGAIGSDPRSPATRLRDGSHFLSRAFVPTSGLPVAYHAPTTAGAGPGAERTTELRFRFAAPTTDDREWWTARVPEVDWFQADLVEVAQFTGSPVSSTLRYPATDDGDILLELVDPIDVRLAATDTSQTFASPSHRVDVVRRGGTGFAGPAPTPPPGSAPIGPFLPDDLPRLLGLFPLTDFLPAALGSPTIGIEGQRRVLSYATDLVPRTTDPAGGPLGILVPQLDVTKGGRFELKTTITGTAVSATTVLSGVSVDLGSLVEIPFHRIELIQEGGRTRLSTSSAIGRPRLVGPLQMVGEVIEALPAGLFGDAPAVKVTAATVTAAMVIDIPSVAFGAFSLRNLSLEVRVFFHLGGEGMGVRLSLGTRNRPFQINVGIFVGGGYLALGAEASGGAITPFAEGAIELGAGVAVDLALASGVVEAVAGLWFEVKGGQAVRVAGYVRVLGTVRVKYLGSMTMRAELSLTYDGHCTVYGRGSYSIEIDVFGLFSGSVSIDFDYSFKTAKNDPPLLELLATAQGPQAEWDDYWAAFGTVGKGVA